MKKILIPIAIFIAAFLLSMFRTNVRDLARAPIELSSKVRDFARSFTLEREKNGLPQETRITATATPSPATVASTKPVSTPTPSVKASEINLAVPFVPQAPFANWDLPYQEACEETSAILVDKFYKNESLTPQEANVEILKLVDWQKRKFGYYMHTTAAETATILKEYFGYKRVDVLYDISSEDIKKHLLAGRPVIVPVDGQQVGNPYYRQPGPSYHMLVVKGFTADGKFITNDVGTKRGYNYVYDIPTFYNAIHDAPSGGDGPIAEEVVRTGRKAIVVVYPN